MDRVGCVFHGREQERLNINNVTETKVQSQGPIRKEKTKRGRC